MPSAKSRFKYTNQYKKNSTNSIENSKAVEEELLNDNNLDSNNKEGVVANTQETVSETEVISEVDNKVDSEQKLQSIRLELEDWKNRAIRLTADIQNLQTQARHDENIIRKNTKKNLINSLIPFLNTLNLAFSYAPNSEDPKIQKFINALQGSFNSLTPELNKNGIEIILPKSGEVFDPLNMTALNQSDDANLTVKQIVGIGIRIDGQLTVPANVMV
jgi:molecular chaperone GrpE